MSVMVSNLRDLLHSVQANTRENNISINGPFCEKSTIELQILLIKGL